MKRLLLFLPLFVCSTVLTAAPHDAEWKKVDRLMEKKLPQSAIALLVPMEKSALAAKDWPEAVRARATRILIESEIEADKPDGRLTRIEAAIASAPAEMLPVLQTLAAEWFYEYFDSNRWKIMHRTQGAGGADIATWGLSRLLAEIDARFQKALSNAAVLRQTPVAQWGGLLKAGGLPDNYQPTLYDFLAGESLAFYTMVEQAGAAEDDEFEFTEASPALGNMEEFLAWQPGAGTSSYLKAIRLYHEVLSFHKDDADPGALVMVDLQRLEWVRKMTNSDAAEARALQQFTALYQKHAAHEISLRARSLAAHLLDKDDKPADARKLLQEGLAPFEKSIFAPRCRNQIKAIEHRELNVGTELVWNAAQPEIEMTYRNLKKVFFRLYPVSENPQMPGVLEERYVHGRTLKRALQKKPVRAWQVDLPPADDFREHKLRVPAPVDLKPGYYLLCAGGNEGFGTKGNMIAATHVWVTPLALMTRKRETSGVFTLDGWVLDAVSGEPVKGAAVTFWEKVGNKGVMKKAATITTGEDGLVSFQKRFSSAAFLFAKHDGHVALSVDLSDSRWPSGSSSGTSEWDGNTTFFFTDRAIYRPGQTIRFKGIRAHLNKDGKGYRTVPDVKRHTVLYDTNGREVAAVDAVTNEFGSFSGSFTAPQQGLTGEFTIYDAGGRAGVHVEEYKRPKFRVEIDPPAAAPKLGEEVAVKVKALAYTGAPVDGADVEWRVMREAKWPSWSGSGSSDVQEIAHGAAKTGADGSAEVKFTAVPDKDADEKSEPWFVYQVHADITDPAGETQSAERSVSAGYAAMKAELEADDWQSTAVPAAITARTTTLDGEPLQAEGTLTVYRLVQPEKVHRKAAAKRDSGFPDWDYYNKPHNHETKKDLSDPNAWDSGEVVQRDNVKTDAKGETKVSVRLAAGAYRAMLEAKDRFGRKVTAQKQVIVVDPESKKFPVRMPFRLAAPSWELQPGGEFTAQWGTGYDMGRAFIEIEHRHKIVQRFWTNADRTQQGVTFKVTEEHRGGFTLHVTQMRENRLLETSQFISVPWSNKDLKLKWEHLTSKLEPGAKDTWTLSVEGPGKEKAAAEVAAVLYDASLDALTPHTWIQRFDCFSGGESERAVVLAPNGEFQALYGEVNDWWGAYEKFDDSRRGWSWLADDGYAPFRASKYGSGSEDFALLRMQAAYSNEFNPVYLPQTFGGSGPSAIGYGQERESAVAYQSDAPRPDTAKRSARKNMQETAFFFPHLTTAEDGTVKMSFTMPESVTTWNFMGFAHDKELRSGFLSGETVTARELIVQPNPPRFLREGDTVEFTVKITNQGDAPQQGTARLNFSDAVTMAPADAALGNQKLQQEFAVPVKESRTLSWRITVPDGQGFLTWKAMAVTEKMSDGEEGWLPVLSRRIPVTESLPLPIRDAGEKEFTFKKLIESAGSQTLRHQSLTVQMVSQPAWYAVMALPYLMEFPHECSEQTFNRFYANALARHIANSDPKIRRVFNLWRDAQPEAMKSPLEKNADLKSLLIEETPWLREAQTESKRSLGILFDDNRLEGESLRVLRKLEEKQLPDGAWPWFPGGPGSDFITLYIVAGFGRLQHLGVQVDTSLAVKALDRLDGWFSGEYRDIVKRKAKGADNFTSTIALYLYARSFYLEQRPVSEEQKEALDYFLNQARKHWTGLSRMCQAHAALGLHRFGDAKTPGAILASLKERALRSEEPGLYWADGKEQWSWQEAPVETQALMIEAFRDIAWDEKSVDDCQVWLLKQKQTQAWPTTKATADAVYALLLSDTSKLASDALVAVSLGGKEVKPEKGEAGTGFFEKKFAPAEIKADMGAVKLVKTDRGIAWGSVHWQYTEDISKITPHESTPLKVTKSLFVKENTKAGPELRAVQGKVKVGDELVVRLELRTDRDMEFVHLKDQRPSSVEPVNVLSGYHWQDGLGYYESTRDTASHFFFDALPKGTYVFEYSARVQLRGKCQAGIAELQCMYAPEFNSHSASAVLEVE